ncbi:DUF4136 domain-containing protein [Marinilabiliaceae bacterium JC017]|nr:DUF4136 domain-containing protein [Marinilabiliaceae bacterium JC017]
MKKLVFALFTLTVMLTGCSGIKTTYDYDRTIDFTAYQTFEYFGWDKGSDALIGDFDKQRIEKAFAEEFKKRDLHHIEKPGSGDLIVTLHIVTKKQTQRTASTTHVGMGYTYGYGRYYGYGPGWGWGGGMSSTQIYEHDYTVGTLMCSVFDAQKKQLIWEGAATKTIDENPRMREKSIPYAVKALMRSFPIKPVKR